MKNRNAFSLFILILVIFGLFAACADPSDSVSTKNYTVKFEANGGSPAPKPQTIARGGKVAMPPAMTKTDFYFGGWYKEAACTHLWNFTTDTVSGNITLYAMWNSAGSSAYTYTVNFQANGGIPAPDPQNIADGGKVDQPPAMTKTGHIFGGWYKEAACTHQWNFAADTVTGDIILYAQWISATVVTGTTLADKLAWLKTNAERDSAYLLEVTTAYEELAPQNLSYTGRNNITIQLQGIGSGRVIGHSDYVSLFSIGDGVTLILDKNLILSGTIQVNSGGTLIMNQGAKITGNTTYDGGGGVSVNGGTFIMNGGEISGNTIDFGGGGGGVYVGQNGTFTMSGGKISGNTASGYIDGGGGGGVYVDRGTFTMSGGEISGNTAAYYSSSSYGGGVYVGQNGTFTMNGGEISGNTAGGSSFSSHGGGVYVGGTFTMNGGEISGNTVDYFDTPQMLVISASNGDPTATGVGDEILLTVTVTENGDDSDGGVYVASNATFTMNGGEISGNTNANTANDPIVSYQWYNNSRNSNTGGAPIPGAIGEAYQPPTDVEGTTYYYVVITTESGKTRNSNPMRVTVVYYWYIQG